MARYMVEASHSPDECQQNLDNYAEQAAKVLDKAEFGCEHGAHTAWMTIEAGSPDEARNMLPPPQRAGARVVQVEKYTAEQIRQMHMAA